MPDTFARMRQLIGTTVEWAANDLVIGLGEFAVERTGVGDFRIKVGDGVSKFSALPYASSVSGTLPWDAITGKPTTFTPSPHNHPPGDISGLTDAGGKISLALMPQTVLDRMDWRGSHTPTAAVEYPLAPVQGDTWGIAGPAYTFTTGPLAGKTVGEGSAITRDNNTWFMVGGGPGGGGSPADYVLKSELIDLTTGSGDAGKVPKTNVDGRLDPSFINVPGALYFRGTVDITQPPPVGVNSGDYWLVGIGGVAHAGWAGIAGQTLEINDMVIWNGVQWTYTHTAGLASGFVPLDGSVPMTGPLALPVNAAPAAAHATRKDYLDTRIAAIPSAIAQLGFTPLNPANNLSEIPNDATARTNLGLGTAATAAVADLLQKANNLSDILDDAAARSNIGIGSAGTRADNFFLQSAQNLNDIPDKALARDNLGVPDLSDMILKSTIDAAGDLIIGTANDTVARLARGTQGQVLQSTAGSVAWGSSLSLVSEVVAAVNTAQLIVAFPVAAKVVEILWSVNQAVAIDQSQWIDYAVDAAFPSHTYTTVKFQGGGVGPNGNGAMNWWREDTFGIRLGGYSYTNGIIRLYRRGTSIWSTFEYHGRASTGGYESHNCGSCAINDSAFGGVNGLRLYHSGGALSVPGSYVRVLAG